mmetsp:Transcript_100412/g.199265  ORF Transcript_100412/g.199265 Transcript_100412/m.199265 type:complete len:481 (+) Transcript_100412:93-1535(+)
MAVAILDAKMGFVHWSGIFTEADSLGKYVVLNKAVVSRDRVFAGDDSVVAKVPVGTTVRVVEVQHCAEERRIRGRLEHPAGWMSLVNTQTGRRWGARLIRCHENHSLQRAIAPASYRCNLCRRWRDCGSVHLVCPQCKYQMCPRCVHMKGPLQAWTFHVTVGTEIAKLGFSYFTTMPMRVVISDVKPGTWAHEVGVKIGDELTAINGVNVEKVTVEELDHVLETTRPLKFTFAYYGSDSVEHARDAGPMSPMSSGSGRNDQHRTTVEVEVALQNVDLAALSNDAMLFFAFGAIFRHAIAHQAGKEIAPEGVELEFSVGPPVVVRCILVELPKEDVTVIRTRLGGNYAALISTLNEGLRRLHASAPGDLVSPGQPSATRVHLVQASDEVQHQPGCFRRGVSPRRSASPRRSSHSPARSPAASNRNSQSPVATSRNGIFGTPSPARSSCHTSPPQGTPTRGASPRKERRARTGSDATNQEAL